MIEVGRVCLKVAGREAGQKCVVVDVADRNYVLIDGNVKRKRCSISHLEPLAEVLGIEKGASHDDVVAVFEKLGLLASPKRVKRFPKAKKESASQTISEKKKPSRARKVSEPKPATAKSSKKPKA